MNYLVIYLPRLATKRRGMNGGETNRSFFQTKATAWSGRLKYGDESVELGLALRVSSFVVTVLAYVT